jgi:alpha-tubulin suppressor-like RCC1 family protein
VDVSVLAGPVTRIDTGDSHTCAVVEIGRVLCWGSNAFGQVGDGRNGLRLVPVNVNGLSMNLAAVSAGGLHTCALTSVGGVKCWGNNAYGQLGDGTTTDRVSPVDVVGLSSSVVAIAAGGFHTCALLIDGTVKCWGNNVAGQLGDGTNTSRSVPVEVPDLTSVTALAAGMYFTCSASTLGRVHCWGDNNSGQLGDGTLEERSTPHRVNALLDLFITDLAAGEDHICALSSGGLVKCWGANGFGQLGDGTTTKQLQPVDVLGLSGGVTALTAGNNHTCALASGNTAKCWGSNTYGQLGDGTGVQSLTPVIVAGLAGNVIKLSAGGLHTCAEVDGGVLECWGDNWTGQLGNGSTVGSISPVNVPGISGGLVDLDAGTYFTCIVNSVGGAQCWGAHGNGQIGDGSLPWNVTPTDVVGLSIATLTVNYPVGMPGSYFTFTGSDFMAYSPATITVNGFQLAPTINTDESGKLVFLLRSFSGTDLGYYVVKVVVDLSAATGFMLDASAPLRDQSGTGQIIYDLPYGIALDKFGFLPVILR